MLAYYSNIELFSIQGQLDQLDVRASPAGQDLRASLESLAREAEMDLPVGRVFLGHSERLDGRVNKVFRALLVLLVSQASQDNQGEMEIPDPEETTVPQVDLEIEDKTADLVEMGCLERRVLLDPQEEPVQRDPQAQQDLLEAQVRPVQLVEQDREVSRVELEEQEPRVHLDRLDLLDFPDSRDHADLRDFRASQEPADLRDKQGSQDQEASQEHRDEMAAQDNLANLDPEVSQDSQALWDQVDNLDREDLTADLEAQDNEDLKDPEEGKERPESLVHQAQREEPAQQDQPDQLGAPDQLGQQVQLEALVPLAHREGQEPLAPGVRWDSQASQDHRERQDKVVREGSPASQVYPDHWVGLDGQVLKAKLVRLVDLDNQVPVDLPAVLDLSVQQDLLVSPDHLVHLVLQDEMVDQADLVQQELLAHRAPLEEREQLDQQDQQAQLDLRVQQVRLVELVPLDLKVGLEVQAPEVLWVSQDGPDRKDRQDRLADRVHSVSLAGPVRKVLWVSLDSQDRTVALDEMDSQARRVHKETAESPAPLDNPDKMVVQAPQDHEVGSAEKNMNLILCQKVVGLFNKVS